MYTHIPVIGRPEKAVAITRSGVAAFGCVEGNVITTVDGAMVTVVEAVEVAPRLSVTRAVTVYVPATEYWCVCVALLLTLPSPKSITVDAMLPSGSDDPTVVAVTCTPVYPLTGVTPSTTFGG